jgi:DNA repair exonuclease SbcCD ATPase subunit
MWGEQNLLKQRDVLVQKLRGITPTPTAEIDELRTCSGKKLKHLIVEIEKLYNEVLVPIATKTKTVATHTSERNKLKNQYNENKRQKEQIIQETDGLEEGSQEYTERLEGLQNLINKGKPLSIEIALFENSIKAETNAITAHKIVRIKKQILRTATTKEDAKKLDVMIGDCDVEGKSLEQVYEELEFLANEVTYSGITKSSTSEAEELIAKSRRAKQAVSSSPITQKAQPMYRNVTDFKSNLLPLAEEEY